MLKTCFLFSQTLSETGGLSLSLDQQGQLIDEPSMRSFEEIKTRQMHARLSLVLPAELFSLHQVTLPCLPEKKARAAIPFALEEQVAQAIDYLHIAFDQQHYQHGRYLVVVCDKAFLVNLMAQLTQHGIHIDCFTLDWFALQENEFLATDTHLLVNHEQLQGALSAELIEYCPLTFPQAGYLFTEKPPKFLTTLTKKLPLLEVKENYYTWLAKRLQSNNPINLCQGELHTKKTTTQTKRWHQAALLASMVCIASILSTNFIKLYMLNHEIKKIDTQIASIYQYFFPNAKQIINPRWRISQLLKTKQNPQELNFWLLMNRFAQAFKHDFMNLQGIHFQNTHLLLTLLTKNFAVLEQLETYLKQKNIKVKRLQATTSHEQILGSLDLTL